MEGQTTTAASKDEDWINYGCEIYTTETQKDDSYTQRAKTSNFTVGAIRRASLQWYKMKWQFTASPNDLWGQEVQGYSENVSTTPLPDCPLFKPGGITQIRIRFFNLLSGDDASNDFRCAFLKFSDNEDNGPFDLAFTTGRVSCYDSVSSLQAFLTAVDGDEDSVRDWALYQSSNYYSLVDGLRRFPKCWGSLDYYNHATFTVDMSGEKKWVRFRLHGNADAESRLSKQEQEDAWIIGRPDMELPSDSYLHTSMEGIAKNNRHMTLQVQIRSCDMSDPSILSPLVYWDDQKYPWQDLSDLTMTYCVPRDTAERAKYNFSTQPDYIRMETLHGKDNFGGLIHIREKVLTSTTRRKRPEALPDGEGKTTTYLIHVETGKYLFSGTDAGVYISLYGTKGRTKKVLLDKLFHDDFERGSKEAYYITVPVIGEILFVKVFLIGGKYTLCREWFLNNIVIYNLSTKSICEIPCYRWISDKMTLPSGKATLAMHETNIDRQMIRRLYLEEQGTVIPWASVEGLPGRIGYKAYNDLPLDLKFAGEREWHKKYILTDVMFKLKLHQYATVFHSFDSFEEFKDMASVIPMSETSKKILEKDRWKTDEEFGRQFLCGVNPVLIQKMDGRLDKFPVTEEHVGKFLQRGISLDEEMKAGNIYFVDYHHFGGLERRTADPPKYLAEPLVMLYVRPTGDLVPIAIQLQQVPGADNPIWTPTDTEEDWLLVKMWVKSADSTYQSIYTHLFRVHILMEALTVAMLRNIPVNHPVYKLLMPHARYTVAVSTTGRDILVSSESSVFDKLFALNGNNIHGFMSKRFKDFHYRDLIAPREFEFRGVADDVKLPRYRYRDDSMLLWNTISVFVSKIMKLYYHSDSDVSNDPDLNAFMKDVHDCSLPNQTRESNGVPETLNTFTEMVEFLTSFIFQSSVFHAAMNYPQADYFAFGPNYPSGMRKPPPTTRGGTTLKDIIDSLPNKSDQAMGIAFSAYLSEPMADEVYLPDNTDNYFTEPAAREILDWFSDELEEVSRIIQERNTDYYIPYEYLLPEKIPKSAGQ